jgi:L-ascorbate metabolism protein UlaG (beta-lactamase superfamily)
MKLTLYHQSALIVQSESGAVVAVDFGQEVPADTVAAYTPAATFLSHQHPDHFHMPHIVSFGAPVYAPNDVLVRFKDFPHRLNTISAGGNVNIGDLSVSAFDVDHGPNLSANIDNLGFTFISGGRRLLFLGDMGAASDIPQGTWDVVLVPVGGSKVFDPAEAADYVARIGHNGVVVPIHYHGRADRASGERFRAVAESMCDVRLLNVGQELAV